MMKALFKGVLAAVLLGSGANAATAAPPTDPASYLMNAIRACWSLPDPGANTGAVRVKIALRPDGSLEGNPVVLDAGRSKPVEHSAVRAILRCAPFKGLEAFASSYEDWREVTITFSPSAE